MAVIASCFSLAFCLAACGGSGASSPPSEGNWFSVQALEAVSAPGGGTFLTNASGIGVQAQMTQEGPNPTGVIMYYPSRFTDFYGKLFFASARLPATWRFLETTGPCAGKVVADLYVQNTDAVDLTCTVTVNPARDFGYLDDGTPVYTGGDDKLVFNFNGLLYPSECRTSGSGGMQLCYQSDGNFVLYRGGTAVWASNTAGTSAGFANMQGDGNLVVYNAAMHPVWASNTNGYNGSFVAVQNNNCAVMYYGGPNNLFIPWGTSTCQ